MRTLTENQPNNSGPSIFRVPSTICMSILDLLYLTRQKLFTKMRKRELVSNSGISHQNQIQYKLSKRQMKCLVCIK